MTETAGLREVKPAVLPDQADRDAARKSLDRSVVVTAGAGTGKTALLTDRALFTLLGRGVPAQSLVALTFTEKAAGEIRARLGERLSSLTGFLDHGPEARDKADWREAFLAELRSDFGVGPEKAGRLARAALEDIVQAPIGTLHGFAARLLRAYPLEAGVDPGFQVDEGDLWEELFESQWAAWLDCELGERAPREKQWIELLRLCPLEDLEQLARALCMARARQARLDAAPSGMNEWLEETIRILEAEPGRQPRARGNIEGQLKEIVSRLRRLSLKPSRELPGRLPSTDLPGASWPAGWDGRERDRWEAAKRLCERCSPEAEFLFLKAGELLRPFAEGFRRRLAWSGLVSFDGLLLAARDLVRDNRRVREELKAAYRAFLVDEFQDTDPLQGELLMYLAEKRGQSAGRWQDAELEPGKLFVVGDPKQSIYRFRGADIAAYEGFIRHMLEQREPAASCELKSNFRSQAGLLACVNAAFETLMKPVPGSQPRYQPIGSARPGRDGGVELVAVAAAGSDCEPPAARVRRAEAEWIAGWIESNRRRVRYKDVALLFRSATPLGEYLELFKGRGIPYVVEGEKYFYGTQEVQDFLNLLRVLDDPGDKTALAGLLRSPAVGLTDEELRRLAVAQGLSFLKDPPDARLGAFFGVLRGIRSMVGRRPLGEILEAVFDRTRILELACAAYHGQQTLANLLKLGRLAATAAEGRGETLKGFIRRVSRFIAEAREEGESPLADERLDAVRVLTIHKSKGLEYPVVILPNLSGAIAAGREGRLLRVEEESGALGLRIPGAFENAAMAYLDEKERRREKDEQIRLLYVAFTRAKDRLILLGSKTPRPRSLAGLLEKEGLWPSLGPGVSTLELPLETAPPAREARPAKPEPAVPLDGEAAARSWRLRLEERDKLQSLPRFASAASRASPRGKSGSPRAGLAAAADSPARPPADLVGRLCHKALERWDFKAGARGGKNRLAEALGRAAAALSAEAAERELAAAAEEAGKILERFLKSPLAARLGRAEILGREVPFVFSKDGQTARGAMDLLIREDGRLKIADYKTDSVKPPDLIKKARHYEPQMSLYAQAAGRALDAREVGYCLIFLRLGRAVEGTFKL